MLSEYPRCDRISERLQAGGVLSRFWAIPHPLMNRVSFGSVYELDKTASGGSLIPVSPLLVVHLVC
jgi:hypothetical protein